MLKPIFLFLMSCFVIVAQGQPEPPDDIDAAGRRLISKPTDVAAEQLRAHGIGMSARELLSFLNEGFPRTAGKVPAKPVEKTQLTINAMAKLAVLGAKEAVPVLTRIASLDLPKGAMAVLEADLKNTAPEERENFKRKAMHLLQYNAVTALGALGDPSCLDVCRQIFTGEQSAAAKIQYALCLASLGDASGIDYLVQVIQQENRRESAAASRAFYFITGQDLGYSENTPLKMRKTRAKAYRDWWRQNKASFQLNPADVMQRRLNPVTEGNFEPRSTRDLLKLASYYLDFNNELRSAQARQNLKDAGRSINPELERIAADTAEELNIRLEAINWHFEANRGGSRTLLKKLRRDENSEIADKADTLLVQIDEDERGPAALRQ